MKFHYKQIADSILVVKPDKRNECFNFGADNAFPSLIEALIRMSVSSKTCTDRASKAIYGGSFGEAGDVIINSKGQSLNEVLRLAARWYAKQNNCYLQISYDGNFDIRAIVVVPVTDVRVGKADDRGYSGKFIVYDNWDKSRLRRVQSKNFVEYHKYNPDKEVVEGQIETAGGIEKYNGQILHIRKDETYIYSLSDLEPVLSEALLENNSQVFRSRGAEKGFLNTKLMTVAPFKDDDTRKEFKDDINELRGADGSNDLLLLELAQNSDDVSKQIDITDLSGTYNDKLFEYSDKQAETNICKAFTVPQILINPSDNTMFGNSGEMLREAKLQLWETRKEDRNQLEEAFAGIMEKFSDDKAIEGGLAIVNPYIDTEEAEDAKNINKKAQATLRGSVGGVTALIQLVSAVKDGKMDKENAVAVVQSIYGFTVKKAKEMIGGFEEEEKTV